MNWYLLVLTKYAVFDGRARRTEYWMYTLFNVLIAVGLSLIDRLFGQHHFLYSLYLLAVLLPSVGVSIRRLHDTDRSGWWLLLAFVPVVGAIVLLVLMCMDSQPGGNEYGANPKGA
jgi:uncharacterized membrane protein YhaH (DUF805 family)